MKKKFISFSVCLSFLALVAVIYQLGNRKVTIIIDGKPITTEQVILVSNGKATAPDENGTIDLPWGLTSKKESILYNIPKLSGGILAFPKIGQRHYEINEHKLVKTDTLLNLVGWKISERTEQINASKPTEQSSLEQ